MYSVQKVPGYRSPLYHSTGTRFKKLFLSIVLLYSRKVIFETYNPYIWDRRENCSLHDIRRGRVRGAGAAGAAFLRTANRGKLLEHKLIHVQCTKKSTRV